MQEAELEAEISDLAQALGEAAVETWVWKKGAEGRLIPSSASWQPAAMACTCSHRQ